MKITRIERIALEMPYAERVQEHLRKGWGLGNRATDEEFAADSERFHQQWRDSKPPTAKTSRASSRARVASTASTAAVSARMLGWNAMLSITPTMPEIRAELSAIADIVATTRCNVGFVLPEY